MNKYIINIKYSLKISNLRVLENTFLSVEYVEKRLENKEERKW